MYGFSQHPQAASSPPAVETTAVSAALRPRGRSSGLNPPNRFETHSLHVLSEVIEAHVRTHPDGRQVRTQVLADHSRRVINHVDSPDLGIQWTLNPYRGCEHGCIYCYARPTHETLGFSCGLDFETRIMAKLDAPRLLQRELASPTWHGEPIHMAGVTDVYQPVERTLNITRQCLEVMAACRQPVRIVTKNHLVTRDVDLLAQLARHDAVTVSVSLTTMDESLSRAMEPRASAMRDRLRAIRTLSDAGIPTTAMIAPVIPHLTTHEMPTLLDAAQQAGACSASWMMLRLPFQLKDLFLDWLQRTVPHRANAVENALRGMHAGKLYDSTYETRFTGTGPLAEQIASTFQVFARRRGLDENPPPISGAAFTRPALDGQLPLFAG
jgi:DNA repair photolyase